MTTKRKNIVLTIVMAVLFIGLSLCAWFKPADEYSDSERRLLAQFPEITLESVLSGKFMTDFESYTLDQFPARDEFRSLKAVAAYNIFEHSDNNGIYIYNGYASKMEYPMNQYMLDNAAEKFEKIYNLYFADNDTNVYFSIIPDKNFFLAEDSGYLAMDYDKLISYMQEKTDYMEYIDITGLLELEDYYLTDTHWKQERITDVAKQLAASMGAQISGEYTENTLERPFYGVYYGQAAIPLEPDTIKYLTADFMDSCIVTSYNTGMPEESFMYNMEKAEGKDAYEMFLSGSDALMTVENPNADTDKELILFRDSFGSSIAPLLAEGYSKITLVDIRYVQSDMLGYFIQPENQDVLFLYSTLQLNNSTNMK